MTDERHRNGDETPEPSEEELERAEAEFVAELAKDRPRPLSREVVRTDVLWFPPPDDFVLPDLFPRNSKYMEGDNRISHALIRWRGGGKAEPTHLLGWWAPYRLLRPEELAEAESVSDLDALLVERGVVDGAAVANESFTIAAAEDEQRELLELEPEQRIMYVASEYRDRDRQPILLMRQFWASGSVGRVRDLTWEKRHGGSYRFEY